MMGIILDQFVDKLQPVCKQTSSLAGRQAQKGKG